jgi:hypothetical protein
MIHSRTSASLCLIIFFLISSVPALAATRYVDKTLSANITNGTYSIANRNSSGSAGNAYTTILAAINACSVGDTIYMRGGTYNEHDIYINASTKSGTAWTAGNYTTLASYPGEWAILNGGNTGSEFDSAIYNIPGYDGQSDSYVLKYWTFEHFEITGYWSGMWMKGGPCKYRYLYIHDNKVNQSDGLKAGLFIQAADANIIEYCYFKDNQNPSGPYGNNANLIFDGDYRDTTDNSGQGLTFVPNQSVRRNIIRYNYFTGSAQAIRYKGDQRFGLNGRNPDPSGPLSTYKSDGDDIHHNIILAADLVVCQDFAQVHNNILAGGAALHAGKFQNVPPLYDMVVYNNSIMGSNSTYYFSSGWASDGTGTSFTNYYDSGTQHTVHPWFWAYNNISDGTQTSVGNDIVPYIICRDMPTNSTNPNFNASNAFFERNFVHSNSDSTIDIYVGHNTVTTDSNYSYQTVTKFNSFSDTARGLTSGTVKNWANSTSGLYLGTSGANQYKTNGSFVVSGSTTIANGGKGGSHPYLSGITFPSYIGAVDPSDSAWVDTVMGLVNVSNLVGGGGTADTTPPASPLGINLQIIQ